MRPLKLQELALLWARPRPDDPGNETGSGRTEPADNEKTEQAKATPARDFRQPVKRIIVGAALWGFLPARLASWLIRRAGLRNA